jgi:chemotaxis-related protein WspD
MTPIENSGDNPVTPASPHGAGCWSRIGVAGDRSCDLLAQHAHCRNCGEYADAAQQHLARPVDDAYLRDWAEHFRAPQVEKERLDASAVVFRIGREWLALPTAMFVRVAPHATPHKVPHRGGRGLRGIVNIAGRLYPCVALSEVLGIAEDGGASREGRHTFARLLLVQWEDQAYALPVADLHGIVRYASGRVQAPAATINKGLLRFLTGVLSEGDLHVGCLDVGLVGHQLARVLR